MTEKSGPDHGAGDVATLYEGKDRARRKKKKPVKKCKGKLKKCKKPYL